MTGDALWNMEEFADDGCQYSNSITTSLNRIF